MVRRRNVLAQTWRDSTCDDDRELIQRAREDQEAFGRLYQKYLKMVYNYVYYRVGHVEEAEDITESVFLHALLNFRRYQDRGLPFSAWLMKIAHNLVANWYRREGRGIRVPMDSEDTGELASQLPSPEEVVEAREDSERILRLIRELPEERQQALILRYAAGLKHREIGEVMGKSTTAVKVLLHRTVAALGRRMRAEEGLE
jgi:RNA polymerase sigma-70 factor (ECF subfamily)